MIRRTALCALALALTTALAACGEKREPTGPAKAEKLSLLLDFYPNADHAGIYMAQSTGEFAKAGLDVKIEEPTDPATTLKLLAARKVDLVVSYEPEVLLARAEGQDLVSIGAIIQRPLTSIIGLDGNPKSAADLEGHTIGTAGIPYQSAYLKTILKSAGADPSDVKEINVGFNFIPALLSKKVYATLGAFWNVEGVELDRRKKSPKIIPVDQAGVPTYDELVIVARREDVGHRGALLRRFMQAVSRGTKAVQNNPAAGVTALLKANPDLDEASQKAALDKTMPAFFPSEEGKPFGWQNPEEWAAYTKWMEANDLLKRPLDPGRALTNEFLPGEGV